MGSRGWVFDPHSGGVKIPPAVQERTVERINRYAAAHYGGKYTRLDVRFRGPLCYIDAFTEPEEPSAELLAGNQETRAEYYQRMRSYPLHLCRLRYFGDDRWSFAFFTYSNEKYAPCMFRNGTFFGTPEEAFEQSAGYLKVQ